MVSGCSIRFARVAGVNALQGEALNKSAQASWCPEGSQVVLRGLPRLAAWASRAARAEDLLDITPALQFKCWGRSVCAQLIGAPTRQTASLPSPSRLDLHTDRSVTPVQICSELPSRPARRTFSCIQTNDRRCGYAW